MSAHRAAKVAARNGGSVLAQTVVVLVRVVLVFVAPRASTPALRISSLRRQLRGRRRRAGPKPRFVDKCTGSRAAFC
jgi:hypothetical protein